MDTMCTLHDSDEYGVCRWPLTELARAAGVPVRLLRELADKAVLKGSDGAHEAYVYTPWHAGQAGQPVVLVQAGSGPCWYSSRMVRDEHVRQARGGSSRFVSTKGAPKSSPKASPKPPLGEDLGDGSTSTSPSTASPSDPALAVSARGAIGIALKAAGLDPTSFNLADPRVDALIAAGATPEQWQGLAGEALRAGKKHPWHWVLTVLPDRLNAGKAIKPANRHAGFAAKDYRAGVTDDGFIAAS